MKRKVCGVLLFFILGVFLGLLPNMAECFKGISQNPQNGHSNPYRYPGSTWLRYSTPEEAGWSSSLLEVAKDYYDMLDSAAVMVIYNGAVLVNWGDIQQKFMCHSVRKSFLSALYGIHVHAGNIDLDKTMAEQGIDDEPPLTDEEKQAKVIHLLKARSGVYHEAAYESPGMKASRPPRGSHPPDTFFYYNNWDFNTLGTIFNQETVGDVFEEFRDRIAVPIEMQDFVMETDTYYHYELQYSIHPAYPFQMSARDMARFGYLFLRNGRWNKQQIIPEEWVAESTYPFSIVNNTFGYGYMWWIIVHDYFRYLDIYAASGYKGHMIIVVPGADLVFVHRVDTFNEFNEVSSIQILIMLDLILKSKVAEAKENPVLVPLDDIPLREDQTRVSVLKH
jgi:CubicO group peptidase (beta-lactamase class C family)